jgi:signal recognition particle receptor subunit beta
VDSSQPQLLDEAREELYKALQYEELKDSNLLIFANKQDRPEAISIPEITERLGLNSL